MRRKKVSKRKRNPSDLEILKSWLKDQIDVHDLSYDHHIYILENWEPGVVEPLKIEDQYFEKIYIRKNKNNLEILYSDRNNKLPYIVIEYDNYGNMTLGAEADYWLNQ